MEEAESTAEFTPGSSFSLDDPVQYALSIHLILRAIFTQFGKQKDLKSLLAVRAVCTLWWEEALDILHDFSELLPTILGTHPRVFWSGQNFNAFDQRIKPSDALPIGGLPIKLIVFEWTPQIVRFLNDRADDIASLQLCIPEFGDFCLEKESFRLPNLRFASFLYSDGQDVAARSYHSKRFQDALILFLDLIKHAVHLEKCEVFLTGVRSVAASYQDGLAHLPLNLTKLAIPLDCMEHMAGFQTWPRLNSLRLYLSPGNITLNSACITECANRLISLTLAIRRSENIPATLPRLRLPVLPKLTELELEDFGIHEDLPLLELMPQLKNVKIASSTLDVLSSLVTRDFCHLGVTDFIFLEMGTLPNVNHVARMTAFTRNFPNLVRLSINSTDCNIVETAPIIFSSLQRLRILTLHDFQPQRMDYDLIQVITGVSREEIPEDESTWSDILVGSPNAITKLTDLREFGLKSTIERVVTQRESKFLFKAAFLRMTHLKLIKFDGKILFDPLENQVQDEWGEAGGRVIRIGKFWFEWMREFEDDGDNEVRDQNENLEGENEEGGVESDDEGEDERDNEEREEENEGRDEDE